jgi:hypothetical protein
MVIRANVRHLVGHDDMVLGVDCGLHVVADDPGVLAARCHRTRIRIGQWDVLVLALHHLGIDRTEPSDLFVQFPDFVLNRTTFASGTASPRRSAVSICSM